MIKIKVAESSGIVLDWLVSKCEGFDSIEYERRRIVTSHRRDDAQPRKYTPSTNLAQGGQIIEREHINIRHTFTEGGYRTSSSIDAVHASIDLPNGATQYEPEKAIWEYGPTPLIAAMRCYVRSKFGEEVEVPEELLTLIPNSV